MNRYLKNDTFNQIIEKNESVRQICF